MEKNRLSIKIDDWKTFQKNNPLIDLNKVLNIKENILNKNVQLK